MKSGVRITISAAAVCLKAFYQDCVRTIDFAGAQLITNSFFPYQQTVKFYRPFINQGYMEYHFMTLMEHFTTHYQHTAYLPCLTLPPSVDKTESETAYKLSQIVC